MRFAPAVALLASVLFAPVLLAPLAFAAPARPHILQRPALSQNLIAFGYAGDLWTVERAGGRATRLTTGVGIETSPIFSPDGSTIAFTGEYDGNVDVYTIPASGGIPHRITYHPAPDAAVGWTPDGRNILFRSSRDAASRYTRLFSVPAGGGLPTPLPLPMGDQGQISPDGKLIAYSPLSPAFTFDYNRYVAWGNYRGGRAGTIWITNLSTLASTQLPHETASDLYPVWSGNTIYFLSDRKGPVSLFSFNTATKAVTECVHNTGPDMRSLSAGPGGFVYDQLGEIYFYDIATGKSHLVQIDVTGDLPEVRPRIQTVSSEIEHVVLSPTGLRVAVEAHGEILTVPAKKGPTRNLTNTPGAMERSPAWSPDGQSIAFFSDASDNHGTPGLYQLHIVPQTGAGAGSDAVGVNGVPGGGTFTTIGASRIYSLAPEPTYYSAPRWSPDSRKIAFHDNHQRTWILDTASGKLTRVGEDDIFGGFSSSEHDVAWSPDSRWLAYPHSVANHLHVINLYSLDTGRSTQITSQMADSTFPAFDRNGKYLYFAASTGAGATSDGLDMTSDLYRVTASIYAVVLAADQASPVAPESDDEKTVADVKEKAKENADNTPAGEAGETKAEITAHPNTPPPPATPKPVRIDLEGIGSRIVALPLPPRAYKDLSAGKPGTLYFLDLPEDNRFEDRTVATLSRFVLETRKTEKLAEHVQSFDLSADGEKMLLEVGSGTGDAPPPPPGPPTTPNYFIVPSNAPAKPGEGAVSFAGLQIRVDPAAEWAQMYHEVWRIERAFFYDPNFHGVDTVADERRFEPYVQSIASRSDLNYIFQEMLGAFSVGHLRGTGGDIPEAKKVPGGLLGADYAVDNGHLCIARIYTGGLFNPVDKAPLAQPGLNVHPGDCILRVNDQEVRGNQDIQQFLEGTAGHAINLHLANSTGGNPHDITVIPIRSEATLRNIDWIESNQRKVDQLSGGKLAYVYLPDTAAGGFTNFNRYYFAQLDKQGAVIDERFNAGGQIADYIIEAMRREPVAYWAPRYGAIEHTPNAAIYGPKVMIINEVAGSGGDAMPWLFRHEKVGPLVGKRTWGGLVGISQIPVLMDGGNVTSPSVAFFSPKGEWDVENHGVEPDVTVEQDPKLVSEGHDPQLEKAVAVALDELAKHPPTEPKRPPYPNYHNRY